MDSDRELLDLLRVELKSIVKEALLEIIRDQELNILEFFPPSVTPRQALVNWCTTNGFEVPEIARLYKLNSKSKDEDFVRALADLEKELGG